MSGRRRPQAPRRIDEPYAREETKSVTLVTRTTGDVGWRVASHLLRTSAAVRSPTGGPGSARLPGDVVDDLERRTDPITPGLAA